MSSSGHKTDRLPPPAMIDLRAHAAPYWAWCGQFMEELTQAVTRARWPDIETLVAHAGEQGLTDVSCWTPEQIDATASALLECGHLGVERMLNALSSFTLYLAATDRWSGDEDSYHRGRAALDRLHDDLTDDDDLGFDSPYDEDDDLGDAPALHAPRPGADALQIQALAAQWREARSRRVG